MVFFSASLFADFSAFVLSTDRSANGDLIAFMSENGLEPALEIARALGNRADPFVSDIIEYFFINYRNDRRQMSERVLAVLLAALFPDGQTQADFSGRFAPNREALLALSGALEEFESPDLRARLLRLAAASGEPRFRPLYARLGRRIAARLRETNGKPRTDEYEETLILLEAIGRSGVAELRPVLADIARYSGERLVVERARKLLAPGR